MRHLPDEGPDALLRRLQEDLVDLIGRYTRNHLNAPLGDLAAEAKAVPRVHDSADNGGYERVVAAQHPAGAPPSATPSVPNTTRTPFTDLSHMPPLGDLYDRARREELDIHELTRELGGLQQRYGPYRVENISAWYEQSWVDDDGSICPPKVNFLGDIRDDNGADVGELIYSFTRDDDGKLVVTNEHTELRKGFTGKGFSTAFSAATEDYFRRSGVDRMLVTASLEDGGVTWAKAGYDWDLTPAKLGESVNNMKSRIDDLLAGGNGPLSRRDTELLQEMRARFGGRTVEFPSPRELVMLAGDNPKLGEELMRGSYWHGMKKL
ncbi:hypothetical protein [Nocardia paucivorans]|uniref:hypothetical protein n=1 Tax=Nocardia paucivorans TaxID=114259 RepID=UPI0012FA340F|nr:hypothetical protein [Nocardia paucivorans]